MRVPEGGVVAARPNVRVDAGVPGVRERGGVEWVARSSNTSLRS
ncbi:MAG: hypothetical protein ACJ752_07375 [Gaiellaceae bacterium]